jgi:beta-lactamase class A
LKGQLPKGTPIAHKTGTDGYSVNDVGVITLPNNKGHIAIAVLSNGQTGKEAVSEAAIAGIGRAVHDWFVAN